MTNLQKYLNYLNIRGWSLVTGCGCVCVGGGLQNGRGGWGGGELKFYSCKKKKGGGGHNNLR